MSSDKAPCTVRLFLLMVRSYFFGCALSTARWEQASQHRGSHRCWLGSSVFAGQLEQNPEMRFSAECKDLGLGQDKSVESCLEKVQYSRLNSMATLSQVSVSIHELL